MLFDSNQFLTENIFPSLVWANRKGSCLGVSLLFLLIGETLNIPLHGVMLPGHFFVRYDDGSNQINLEPNRSGYSYTNQEYRKKYNVSDSSWYDLRNLSPDEVMAVLRYTVGNVSLRKKEYAKAIDHYTYSINNLHGFGEAMGNMALAFEAVGKPQKAFMLLDSIKNQRASLPHLHRNLGAMMLKYHKYRQAISEFKAGLKNTPHDIDLLYGLTMAYYQSGQTDSARQTLALAKSHNPQHPEVKRLWELLHKSENAH